MTPQEAARACGAMKESSDHPEVVDFLKTASARDIQTFIHLIQIVDRHRYFYLARVALDVRLSEDADVIAKQLTKQTDRLIKFTVGLYVFTIAIAGFAVIQIIIMLMDFCSRNH
jgi:hypothetical protein